MILRRVRERGGGRICSWNRSAGIDGEVTADFVNLEDLQWVAS